MNTQTKQERGQIAVYGMTEVELLKEICDYRSRYPNNILTAYDYAMCVLSDAQEEIARNRPFTAGKFINKAKYAFSLHNRK